MVKVKMLRHVMAWVPGQVVEVDEATAKSLCEKTLIAKGGGILEEQRKAMPLDEAEKLKTLPVDMMKITQSELEEMGRKNIVATPKDPAFEARLAKYMAPPTKLKAVESEDEDESAPQQEIKKKKG